MRTITRDIAGAFIFSNDDHILLGNNGPTGVYADLWTIPGGGIEEGESPEEALAREVQEEVGLVINQASITPTGLNLTGITPKTLKETGEEVMVDMKFHNFIVQFSQPASALPIVMSDDFHDAQWIPLNQLTDKQFPPSIEATLQKLGYI